MTCNRVALILISCGVLAAFAGRAGSQTSANSLPTDWVTRCHNWTPLAGDKKGTRRRIFPYEFTYNGLSDPITERSGAEVSAVGEGIAITPGIFRPKSQVYVGIVSDPSGYSPTSRFTTLAGTTIDFYPNGSSGPIALKSGLFWDFNHRSVTWSRPEFYSKECVKGDSPNFLEEVERPSAFTWFSKRVAPSDTGSGLAGTPDDASKPSANLTDPDSSFTKPSLENEFSKGTKGPAETPGRSGIDGVFKGVPSAPPAKSLSRLGAIEVPPVDPSKSGEATSPPGPPMVILPAVKNPEPPPVKDEARSPGSVCKVQTLTPMPVPNGVSLPSLQTVGLRNDGQLARAYEYLSAGGDALPLDNKVDVAATVSKLIPYEAVAGMRGNDTDSLWVSIAGIDESFAKRNELAAAKPARTLRMIVVGGASELAISGLDQVGTELTNQGGDSIKLDIEWHAVDQTGSIRPAVQYSSLSMLVNDAAGKAGERPDVLNETQILKLLDDFERLLTSQKRIVDKVFWIKGAYSIPSSVPQRFETFITAVSSSSAVPHTLAGKTGKWLVIVTSRMSGFSIAYLKEPVYSLQIGDVIEEGNAPVGAPRRLITEASLLATRLRLASTVTKPNSDAASDRNAPLAGRLVLDANEVFAERGYVLSPEAATALQGHLRDVLSLWNGSDLKVDILGRFEGRIGKSQPTVFDVIQLAAEKSYPRLPKFVPDWFRKPVRDLNLSEIEKTKMFVATYAAGIDRFVEATKRSAATTGSGCSLFYIAEGDFGFDKFSK
jgi:hypothetical protein